MNAFMEEFLPYLELLTQTPITYVHLHAHNRVKVELSLQVTVHNMPRLIPKHIPHTYE